MRSLEEEKIIEEFHKEQKENKTLFQSNEITYSEYLKLNKISENKMHKKIDELDELNERAQIACQNDDSHTKNFSK